jgi:hypothetical protein
MPIDQPIRQEPPTLRDGLGRRGARASRPSGWSGLREQSRSHRDRSRAECHGLARIHTLYADVSKHVRHQLLSIGELFRADRDPAPGPRRCSEPRPARRRAGRARWLHCRRIGSMKAGSIVNSRAPTCMGVNCRAAARTKRRALATRSTPRRQAVQPGSELTIPVELLLLGAASGSSRECPLKNCVPKQSSMPKFRINTFK